MQTFLQQHTASEAIVNVPKVYTRDAALIVPALVSSHSMFSTWVHLQLSVHIERLIRLNLHLPDPLTGCHAIFNRRLELVAPRTPPAITIAVVVAAQEVALGLRALLGGEWNIDGFEQIFLQLRVQADYVVDVLLLDILGVEAPKEVAGPC